MALVGNMVRLSGSNPMRQSGAASIGSQTPERERMSGSMRLRFYSPASVSSVTRYASQPYGYRPPYAWVLAPKPGAFRVYIDGESSASAAGARGRNISGSTAGVGSLTATGSLIVSAAGTIAGVGTATGTILAALAASGTIAGTSTATMTLTGKGALAGSAAGSVVLSATRYAIGELAGEVQIGASDPLAPENLAAAVWNALATEFNTVGTMGEKLNGAGSAGNPWTETIETGLNAAQAMRLITAAVAGELSGAEGTTIAIRNAVADTVDRIVATVDENGNRTSIAYDLD